VATLNCLHGLDVRRGPPVRPDARTLVRLADELTTLGADVLALQEVDRALERSSCVDQVAALADALGWHGWFSPALLGDPDARWRQVRGGDPGGPAYGVGLLSRFPASSPAVRAATARATPLPGGGDGHRRPRGGPNPGWDREPRVALRVTLATPAGPLDVTTTHLSYLPWRGVRQLRRAAAHARSARAVLAGDLNLPPGVVAGALPRWHRAGGDEPTYPAHEPRWRVDHVLVRGTVDVLDVEVRGPLWSDHRPVVATLRLGVGRGG
jgi:endonuclease/exonuclease/phosphatase family metal-dependent hydrolase